MNQLSRFEVSASGLVVEDLKTGLKWVRAPHQLVRNDGLRYYESVPEFLQTLCIDELHDWRLPTIAEFVILMDFSVYERSKILLPEGHPFDDIRWYRYATADHSITFTMYWAIDLAHGVLQKASFDTLSLVWPVRGRTKI